MSVPTLKLYGWTVKRSGRGLVIAGTATGDAGFYQDKYKLTGVATLSLTMFDKVLAFDELGGALAELCTGTPVQPASSNAEVA